MAWKKEQLRRMELRIRVFKNQFEAYYNRWSGVNTDDRGIFCRRYENTLIDMEYMKKVNNLSIQCAMNEKWDQLEENLKETIGYFTGQTPRPLPNSRCALFSNPTLHRNPEPVEGLFWESE